MATNISRLTALASSSPVKSAGRKVMKKGDSLAISFTSEPDGSGSGSAWLREATSAGSHRATATKTRPAAPKEQGITRHDMEISRNRREQEPIRANFGRSCACEG